MPSLDSVRFDHSNWQPIERKDYMQVWGDDIKNLTAVLSIEFFESAPEIPVNLHDLNGVRFIYRAIANQSGAGLMLADVLKIEGVDCIETLFKMPQPNRGFVYVGSLTIPFAQFSYVIKIQCVEKGFTGLREAAVLDELLAQGSSVDPQTGTVAGWSKDPYEPEETYPFMPNLSENEEYDSKFPEHALSRVRATLKTIRDSLKIDQELKEAEPFRAT